MSFCWTTIDVKDMDESLGFYEEIVGLKINQRFQAGPDMEIAFLGEGETQVELIYNKKYSDINLGENISLGFKVNSVDEKIVFIKGKGLEVHSGPFKPNPSTTFFFVLDPNGLKIQFVEDTK
ncbi:MAG TPA: VOC family protein [Epulopiscium sp.]|nr:VOC family protein [Candidatus Epulonipiscium sp.]